MNYHRGFIAPLLLLIIVAVLVGGGAYMYVQKKQSNQPIVVDQTTRTTSARSDSFVALPTSGSAPLAVTMNAVLLDANASAKGYSVDFGDGSTGIVQETRCAGECVKFIASHTYKTAGIYTAKLVQSTGRVEKDVGAVIVTVTSPTSQTADWQTFANSASGIYISFPNTFKPLDGTADFIYKSSDDYSTQSEELFYYCDGVRYPISGTAAGKACSGPYYQFGVQIHNYVISQNLINSWGAQVTSAKQTTFDGKSVWVIEVDGEGGGSVSIMYPRKGSTVSVNFYQGYSGLYDHSRKPLLISFLGEQILTTLKFNL